MNDVEEKIGKVVADALYEYVFETITPETQRKVTTSVMKALVNAGYDPLLVSANTTKDDEAKGVMRIGYHVQLDGVLRRFEATLGPDDVDHSSCHCGGDCPCPE